MKQNIKKWMLLILYLLVFPIGLQISFFFKKYVSIPVYNFVDRKLEYYQWSGIIGSSALLHCKARFSF